MTTRALDELDGGLGSCPAGEELSVLVEAYPGIAQENKASGTLTQALRQVAHLGEVEWAG